MIEKLYDIDNLYKAFKKVKKASGWKTQTQLYEENLLFNIIELSEKLKMNKYKPKEVNKFILKERGKTRCIESYHIDDRIVQTSFCENILLPLCTRKLIYDNSASLKNRGIDHFRNRLYKHLRDHVNKHGENGYVLLGDFSKFFDNIRHDTFINTLKNFGADEEVIAFARLILENHRIDVSYMNDEEYNDCMNVIFDSIDYMNVDKKLLTGEKMMPKSMGIGSVIAQIGGIIVPYRVDNLVKIVHGIKGYGRYMDDFYVLSSSKEELRQLKKEIVQECESLGICVNTKKTRIVKLSHWFTILKTQYCIEGKRIAIKPVPETFKRERKNIKHLKKDGVPREKAQSMYNSWRGAVVHRYGLIQSVESTDEYFMKVYGKDE